MPKAAMIFAAGFGTRMGVLTQNTPKPLIKVAGKPLLEHAIEIAKSANVSNIVVNTHYLSDQIEFFLKDTPDVQVLKESPDILETGGGLKNALSNLGSNPVYTLNSDMVWKGDNAFSTLLAAWEPSKMDALLLLVKKEKAFQKASAGDFFCSDKGELTRRGNAASAPYIYSGAQIIKTELLSTFNESSFSLNKVWDLMLSKQKAFGVEYGGDWVDVGQPEGITAAEQMMRPIQNV